tara:strand:- start:390 stop:635 length:246 start_codon:yes stop_codon:yes gene_type:complete
MEKPEIKQPLETSVLIWQVQEIILMVKEIESRTETIKHDTGYGYDFLLEPSKTKELNHLVFKIGEDLTRWKDLITHEVEAV